jgi:hypothetical protein
VDTEGYAQYYDVHWALSQQSPEPGATASEHPSPSEDAITTVDRLELEQPGDPERADRVGAPGPTPYRTAPQAAETTGG